MGAVVTIAPPLDEAEARHASPARALGAAAVAALLDEARLSPKPGLVDSRGNGAHADLDLALMERSALSLAPAFASMVLAGAQEGAPTVALRETLGRLGRVAEATMMAATGGVNTHRGAIWALGLLVAAAAIDPDRASAERTAAMAGEIARHPDRGARASTGHKGERACRTFRVQGARGQAQAGFPHPIGLGLPALRHSRARGDSEASARLNALMAIMSQLDDTCVLARGGMAALKHVQGHAADVLAAGGAGTLAGRRALKGFAAHAIAANVSPGGAADLLAATLFLDRIDDDFGALPARHPFRRLHGEA
jgi:triphosphoribosyl-dephospho-CoA synthase